MCLIGNLGCNFDIPLVKNTIVNKEVETRKLFVDYLKSNLGYDDSSFIVEKRISEFIIDLIIFDSKTLDINPIAIIEFKKQSFDINGSLHQIKKYLQVINIPNLPAFLVEKDGVFVLQAYGWQKIDIKDFPSFQKIKKQNDWTII